MKKTVIFGLGQIGKEYVDQGIQEYVQLADNNSSLWGQEYHGLVIENPANIHWQDFDLIVITVGESHSAEIFSQLTEKYRIEESKIVLYSDTMVISENNIYNLGNMGFKAGAEPEPGSIILKKDFKGLLDRGKMNDLEKFFFEAGHRPMGKWLHYFEAYDRFFSKYRGRDVTILEIGVSRGGSLQMWKNYFKTGENNVRIYGIDIDPACKGLEEDHIKIFIGSQEDREFLHKVRDEIGSLDILVDDGGHTMNQQIVTFEELFGSVKDDGVYLCEDLHTSYMEYYGGAYKGKTFIEYSKNLIDYLHAQYSQSEQLASNAYSEKIKYITYCDSMLFIEKKSRTTKSEAIDM